MSYLENPLISTKSSSKPTCNYEYLISSCWSYRLPIFTKSGKPSYHRKGYSIGKIKTKVNPLWKDQYFNHLIYIDKPDKMDRHDIFDMTNKDDMTLGFWANPFLYSPNEINDLGVDVKNYYPEFTYWKWLHRTDEGRIRLYSINRLKRKLLCTNDLLLQFVCHLDPIQHHGQVLLVEKIILFIMIGSFTHILKE